MTQIPRRRNLKLSRAVNDLHSSFVAPPVSLFLLSGHVLDLVCCLLGQSYCSRGLVPWDWYSSLILKLSDDSCQKNCI